MELEELKQRARELHREYAFSRTELSKIMVIVSTTLIIVSIPAALSFQDAAKQAEAANNQLKQASAILNNDRVQRSLDVLRNTEGSSFDQISAALDAFENTRRAVNSTQNLHEDLENSKETYQWLVLIGIIGEVTAAAVFFS